MKKQWKRIASAVMMCAVLCLCAGKVNATEIASADSAIISVKEIKNAIKIMMDILEKLDAIYHALHDKEDNSNGKTHEDDQQ